MNLIRNLIGLIITITMLPICVEAFMFTSKIPFDYSEINDEICLQQLRDQLLISYDMNISADKLSFIYKNKNFTLSLVNRKLLLQPGTQIYLNDVDNLYFETKDGCIYVCYEKGNKQFERILCKKERFYIDDFSDCDVLFDESDSFEE